jgi:cytoskeletal protein CcmA (bactofilin family)
MFGRKKDRDNLGKIGTEATSRELGIDAIPPRPHGVRTDLAPGPARLPATDGPRRLPEITAPPTRRNEPRPTAEGDSKRLIVGREIVLTGAIKACERLVIEGRVEATLTDIRSIEIAETGVLNGTAQVETADVAGRFDGDLVVRNRLQIHATGRVSGNVRYGSIEIERGGTIAGQIETLPALDRAGNSAAEPAASARLVVGIASEPETV